MTERRNRWILVVEPDPRWREMVARDLSQVGFHVSSVADAASGLALYRREGADLVVLGATDLAEACATCRELKTLAASEYLPIVFALASTDTADRIRALEVGDAFCEKSFATSELLALVRNLIRLRVRHEQMDSETRKFRRFALTDPLTELGNRRAFDASLDREWARVQRGGGSVCLALIDIDRFKTINDRFGHATGDRVLASVARSIGGAIREGDEAFRHGGEEFAVLLPDTPLAGAWVAAERIRLRVASDAVAPDFAVTVSLGLATAPAPSVPGVQALVEMADAALYRAKAAGRNCVRGTSNFLGRLTPAGPVAWPPCEGGDG